MNSRTRSRRARDAVGRCEIHGRGAYRLKRAAHATAPPHSRLQTALDSQATSAAARRRRAITAASSSGRGPGARLWSSARGPPRAAPRARSRRRPRARARRAARRRGSRARRSPALRRRMLGTPPSSRSPWINSASAWLRPPATRTSSPSVKARVDLARAAVGVAERRLERLAAARTSGMPQLGQKLAPGRPPGRSPGRRAAVSRRRRRAPPPRPGRRRSATRAPPARPPARRSGSASADRWPG